MKTCLVLFLLTLSGASLFAQSRSESVDESSLGVTVIEMPLEDGTLPAESPDAAATPPAILSIFTVIGTKEAGLPCFNCVLDATIPNIGIVEPAGVINRGGTYEINAFVADQSFTGSCLFIIDVRDSTKTTVALFLLTRSVKGGLAYLFSASRKIPSTAAVGLGDVETEAGCGTVKSRSSSPVYIQ